MTTPLLTVNVAEKNIDENGTVPVLIDDRTMLPIRFIAENFSYKVMWNGDTQTVTVKADTSELSTENMG